MNNGCAWQEEDLRGNGRISLFCREIALTLDQIYEGLDPLTVKEMEALGYGARLSSGVSLCSSKRRRVHVAEVTETGKVRVS